MEKNPVTTTGIIGCGDIGLRVARRCLAAGDAVSALVRRPPRAQRLAAAGIDTVIADLDRPETLPASLPVPSRLLWFAPPPPDGVCDTRLAAFLARLEPGRERPQRIVLISTTAVYGDCHGAWVDECAPLRPGSDRGRRRADAERRLAAFCERHGIDYVILRVAGIYGPGRLPLQRLRDGVAVLADRDAPPANRIHADDLAAACVAALDYRGAQRVFNVSDGHPTTMADYFTRVAQLAGLPPPEQVPRAQAAARLSPGMRAFLQEARRIDNRRLLEVLQVRLQYPDLDSGLRQAVPASLALEDDV